MRGTRSLMRRVASMPFSSGMATSITTISGLSDSASCQRLAPVAGLAHDFHIGLLGQDHLEALAHYRVIVSQQDANSFHSGAATRTSIRTPPPGAERISTSPPALRARARMPIMPMPLPFAAARRQARGRRRES